jgi:hypothetical protein
MPPVFEIPAPQTANAIRELHQGGFNMEASEAKTGQRHENVD